MGETMSTLDMNDPKYYDPFLETLEGNTATNHHTSNALLISVNFGTEIQKKEMKLIYNNHNQLGHIDPITKIAREYLLENILNNMKNKILANKIKARL
jgi:hypothetical protein